MPNTYRIPEPPVPDDVFADDWTTTAIPAAPDPAQTIRRVTIEPISPQAAWPYQPAPEDPIPDLMEPDPRPTSIPFNAMPAGALFTCAVLGPDVILRKQDMPGLGDPNVAVIMAGHVASYEPGQPWYLDQFDACIWPLDEKQQLLAREAALNKLISLSKQFGLDLEGDDHGDGS